MYFKQLQQEEERITNLRIDNFKKAKYERDMKNLAEAMSVKAAKQKGIDHIAKAQKVIPAIVFCLQCQRLKTIQCEDTV